MLLGRRFVTLNGVAILVGAVAGLAAVLFRYLIDLVQNLAFSGRFTATPIEENQHIVSTLGILVVFIPLCGGLLVGYIRTAWPDTKSYGVTEVMAAVQAKGGVLLARTSWGHAILSAITVGTGGSTGREGPIGYIGAAIGSSFGRRIRFNARDMKVLLGCGFSAGIGASFNAPLGGVLMAVELILPEFSTHAFIPVVVATVTGVLVSQVFIAGHATFEVPPFVLQHPVEMLFYLVLGIACGLGAVATIKHLSWTYRAWASFRLPEILKPAAGGLLVGLIGFVLLTAFSGTPHGQFHVFGTGYATISDIVTAPRGEFLGLLGLLVVLMVAKPVATAITIGSGGGGGMFSVSLFQGAVLGGLVGIAARTAFPSLDIDPASYALVGMGAFYAAASRATLTAIVIMAELTHEFTILLPLMFAAVAADAVAVGLSRESLYTIKLTQRGILYEHDRVASPLDTLLVKDVMSTTLHTLPNSITVGEAFNRMLDLGHTGYPVVDGDGRLAGIVTRRDLSKHLHAGKGGEKLAAVVPGLTITAYPEERLFRARDRIFKQDIGRLVVVDPADRGKVVGILTRSDLLRAEAKGDVEHEDAWNP